MNQTLELSQSAASPHLQQLSATGYFSESRRDGAKCYPINPERIEETSQAISEQLGTTMHLLFLENIEKQPRRDEVRQIEQLKVQGQWLRGIRETRRSTYQWLLTALGSRRVAWRPSF